MTDWRSIYDEAIYGALHGGARRHLGPYLAWYALCRRERYVVGQALPVTERLYLSHPPPTGHA